MLNLQNLLVLTVATSLVVALPIPSSPIKKSNYFKRLEDNFVTKELDRQTTSLTSNLGAPVSSGALSPYHCLIKTTIYKQHNIVYKNKSQTVFEKLIAGGGDTIDRRLSLGGGCLGY